MSNQEHDQANQHEQVTSIFPREFSQDDLEAAATLVCLNRGHLTRSAAIDAPQNGDIGTTVEQFEEVSLNDEGTVNQTSQTEINVDLCPPPESNPTDRLSDRLWSITRMHLNPSEILPEPESFTFVDPKTLPVVFYYHSSEVPGEVGTFVDLWDARGHSPTEISNTLFLNNVIVPIEYILRRVGLEEIDLESYFRDESGAAEAGSGSRQTEEDEQTLDEIQDEDSRQSWESELEPWFEMH